MIGIIGAMQSETAALIAAMTDTTSETVSGVTYTKGILEGKEVVVATSGIGKVFAAVCAQTMILCYAPSLLINTGVAGTLTTALSVGDVAVASSLVQHDMDTSPLGDPVGLVSGINKIYFDADGRAVEAFCACVQAEGGKSVVGTVASGDQFIASPEKKKAIVERFCTVACEMEGAAIAHVAFINGTPFAVLRAISDSADGEARVDYPTFVKLAAARSVAVLRRYLREFA
ncbi:MAG: 5'-methylthioadenosine/adenosylhomocysteine nucleosidase [Clostridia bacterium]|nr:5'-methylthioadenosine/adenosylhomocysteine nucleosidase [Clostridia bacterium]